MTPEHIASWLESLNLGPTLSQILGVTGALLYLAVLALLANLLAKRLIANLVFPLIERSAITWDDLLIEEKVIVRLSYVVPAVVVQLGSPLLFHEHPDLTSNLQTLVNVYLIVIALIVLDALLNLARRLWERCEAGKRYPAKSFVQAIKLAVNLLGLIFVLSAILDKSPVVFFSGLGAITAVLLLIFRDAILGLVAGFQLAVNNMVNVGDWISMPARGADGPVIDVSLTTVKVQNWDKTITTIPTYTLISDSFTNWRGMSEAGGRRMKRSVYIDIRSIRFADEELLEHFKRIRILRSYLEEKLDEIRQHNADVGDDLDELINGRRLTNVGTFRAYCVAYLRNHPKIRQDLTLLVRQLDSTEHGLPIEIYAFSNQTEWETYENIQADIFDHLFSILPEFKLKVYQSPSGGDLERVGTEWRDAFAQSD